MSPQPRPGRNRVLTICSTALAGLIATSVGAASPPGDVPWTNPGHGTFGVGSNWGGGSAPLGGDRAIMDLTGSRTITFGANHINDQVRVVHGTWTWNLAGRTYTLLSTGVSALDDLSVQIGFGAESQASRVQQSPCV